MRDWEITASLYKGILFGFRIYKYNDCKDYAFYFPFINIAIIIYKKQ